MNKDVELNTPVNEQKDHLMVSSCCRSWTLETPRRYKCIAGFFGDLVLKSAAKLFRTRSTLLNPLISYRTTSLTPLLHVTPDFLTVRSHNARSTVTEGRHGRRLRHDTVTPIIYKLDMREGTILDFYNINATQCRSAKVKKIFFQIDQKSIFVRQSKYNNINNVCLSNLIFSTLRQYHNPQKVYFIKRNKNGIRSQCACAAKVSIERDVTPRWRLLENVAICTRKRVVEVECHMSNSHLFSLTLNKFSAPARSRSSLLISWLSWQRLVCSRPRQVATRGSEPWNKRSRMDLDHLMQCVARAQYVAVGWYVYAQVWYSPAFTESTINESGDSRVEYIGYWSPSIVFSRVS
uniref:SFRICE_005195 n=1 Tax=Spodoptera frugiperda TaxID=7108 RepID=A0A2H1WBF4_SPOFR